MQETAAKPPRTEQNSGILDFLEGTSCHGDLASLLLRHFELDRDVSVYCPDWPGFGYVLCHVNRSVFAACAGMRDIAVRVPGSRLRFRLEPFAGIGPDWWRLPAQHPDFGLVLDDARNAAANRQPS